MPKEWVSHVNSQSQFSFFVDFPLNFIKRDSCFRIMLESKQALNFCYFVRLFFCIVLSNKHIYIVEWHEERRLGFVGVLFENIEIKDNYFRDFDLNNLFWSESNSQALSTRMKALSLSLSWIKNLWACIVSISSRYIHSINRFNSKFCEQSFMNT